MPLEGQKNGQKYKGQFTEETKTLSGWKDAYHH